MISANIYNLFCTSKVPGFLSRTNLDWDTRTAIFILQSIQTFAPFQLYLFCVDSFGVNSHPNNIHLKEIRWRTIVEQNSMTSASPGWCFLRVRAFRTNQHLAKSFLVLMQSLVFLLITAMKNHIRVVSRIGLCDFSLLFGLLSCDSLTLFISPLSWPTWCQRPSAFRHPFHPQIKTPRTTR